MIDVRELTIGSLVADELGTVLEVTSLSPPLINAVISGRDGSSGYWRADLQPIPLTAEWLERLGWKTRKPWPNASPEYHSYHLEGHYNRFIERMGDNFLINVGSSRNHIRFVHHLQLVMQALTALAIYDQSQATFSNTPATPTP
jgi:hypothetical protein